MSSIFATCFDRNIPGFLLFVVIGPTLLAFIASILINRIPAPAKLQEASQGESDGSFAFSLPFCQFQLLGSSLKVLEISPNFYAEITLCINTRPMKVPHDSKPD